MTALDNVRIVLVRPRGAANLGAVARAMKNMGLGDLALVRPAAHRGPLARTMAVHAADVLEAARVFESIGDAVADCALVVGTTARGGPYRDAVRSPREVAPEVARRARRQRVALVFGPEDHGLANDDLKSCHRLVRIPSSDAYASLNLAQAVIICAYEIFLAAGTAPADAKEEAAAARLAPAGRVSFAFERLQQAFLAIGFLPADNPDHVMFGLRHLLGRTGLREREVRILLALARQIEWYGKGGWREAERKRAEGKKLK